LAIEEVAEEVRHYPLLVNILSIIYRMGRPVRPVEIDNELKVGSRLFPTLKRMEEKKLIEPMIKKKKLSTYRLTQTGTNVVRQLVPDLKRVEEMEEAEDDLMMVFFKALMKEKYGRPDKIERTKNALRVRSELQRQAIDFLRKKGFIEIPPVIISTITDPLRRTTQDAVIKYYGQSYRLTKSMIFHKQIAICSIEKVFSLSPNVRLESADLAETGRHLVEFTQLDLEARGASRSDMIQLAEDLLIHVLNGVKRKCKTEMEYFGRKLETPQKGFKQLEYKKEKEKCGEGTDFVTILSHEEKQPFWIIDFPIESREFYDRENPTNPGVLVDMDLILPEGFGEVLSGGEREYAYDRLIKRLTMSYLRPSEYRLYLLFAKRGLQPSAGFGLGIERLVRFTCGLRQIEETTFFPKIPGDSFSL
jgi:asparaginyl-tRNA synthetase